jgi:hypothetical protein
MLVFINFQNHFYSILTLFLIQDPSILQLYQNEHRESVKGKGKAISVTGHGGTLGCETRFPHFLHNRLTDGAKVVNLHGGHPLPPKKIPGTHFC